MKKNKTTNKTETKDIIYTQVGKKYLFSKLLLNVEYISFRLKSSVSFKLSKEIILQKKINK